MLKKKFILVSMREDYVYNNSEVRFGIDKKLIDWIIHLGFNPILISDLNTLNYFEAQNLFKIYGIILSGGNDINKKTSRYKIEKKLTNISKKKKIPLLGICHGLQFINFYEGGSLKKIRNHVRTIHKIKSKHDYPQRVNSFHKFGIKKLGKNLKIISVSDDGEIEAISHKKYNWLGWMWHPERNKRFNQKLTKIAKSFFITHKSKNKS